MRRNSPRPLAAISAPSTPSGTIRSTAIGIDQLSPTHALYAATALTTAMPTENAPNTTPSTPMTASAVVSCLAVAVAPATATPTPNRLTPATGSLAESAGAKGRRPAGEGRRFAGLDHKLRAGLDGVAAVRRAVACKQ